jgi:hypothetical protein
MRKQESSFSEEKEAKRLLSITPRPISRDHGANGQKFFGSFFQKRTFL